MRVGLLGGSFNPPHEGHIHISEIALKRLSLSQIWWIPTMHNPFKDKNIYESYDVRVQKCEKITQPYSKFYVKQYSEVKTIDLVERLNRKYKNIEFFWIMGADNLENFHKWDRYEDLLKKINFIIVSRETYLEKIKKYKCWKYLSEAKFHIFSEKKLDISSTKIRNSQ